MEEGRFSSSNRVKFYHVPEGKSQILPLLLKKKSLPVEDKENRSLPSKKNESMEDIKKKDDSLLRIVSRTREILPRAKREKPTIAVIIKE